LGYTISRQSHHNVIKSPFRCFNNTDCVRTPPTPVKEKQTYCHECKIARGWND
jgi:hypothetical protein